MRRHRLRCRFELRRVVASYDDEVGSIHRHDVRRIHTRRSQRIIVDGAAYMELRRCRYSKLTSQCRWRRGDRRGPATRRDGAQREANAFACHAKLETISTHADVLERVKRGASADVAANDKFARLEQRRHGSRAVAPSASAARLSSH